MLASFLLASLLLASLLLTSLLLASLLPPEPPPEPLSLLDKDGAGVALCQYHDLDGICVMVGSCVGGRVGFVGDEVGSYDGLWVGLYDGIPVSGYGIVGAPVDTVGIEDVGLTVGFDDVGCEVGGFGIVGAFVTFAFIVGL